MNWLEELLISHQISRYALSKATGISESTLSRIISNNVQRENVKHGIVITIEQFLSERSDLFAERARQLTSYERGTSKEDFEMVWDLNLNGMKQYQQGISVDEEVARFTTIYNEDLQSFSFGLDQKLKAEYPLLNMINHAFESLTTFERPHAYSAAFRPLDSLKQNKSLSDFTYLCQYHQAFGLRNSNFGAIKTENDFFWLTPSLILAVTEVKHALEDCLITDSIMRAWQKEICLQEKIMVILSLIQAFDYEQFKQKPAGSLIEVADDNMVDFLIKHICCHEMLYV